MRVEVSRRTFLADLATAAGAGMLGCSPANTPEAVLPIAAENWPPAHEILIEQYIKDYLGRPYAKKAFGDNKTTVTQTPDTQIYMLRSIPVMDFPNRDAGVQIPVQDSPTRELKKIHYHDEQHPLPGIFKHFVVVSNPKRPNDPSIWAAIWSYEGGFPDGKKPHLEFFPVYENGKWNVKFIVGEEVEPMTGETLFLSAYPKVILIPDLPRSTPLVPTQATIPAKDK